MNSSSAHKKIILVGGGGHAKVLADVLSLLKKEVVGFIDIKNTSMNGLGIEYLGDDETVKKFDPEDVLLVNGIGAIGDNSKRSLMYNQYMADGYQFATIVHPSSIVGTDVRLGPGVQLMAGSVIQAGCALGSNCIVNTGATIDHDCSIGDHVHISSGATVCGDVEVGELSHVGAGATVLQGVCIGRNVLIGAGAAVLKNVEDNLKVVGVPARPV